MTPYPVETRLPTGRRLRTWHIQTRAAVPDSLDDILLAVNAATRTMLIANCAPVVAEHMPEIRARRLGERELSLEMELGPPESQWGDSDMATIWTSLAELDRRLPLVAMEGAAVNGCWAPLLAARVQRATDTLVSVMDIFDRPTIGVSTYRGGYVYFEMLFDRDADEYNDVCALWSMTEPEAEAAGVAAQLFLRWKLAGLAWPPPLPEDAPRYHAANAIVDAARTTLRDPSVFARAMFPPRNGERGFTAVEWTEVSRPVGAIEIPDRPIVPRRA